MGSDQTITMPPPPKGFVLDSMPPPPGGFSLDKPLPPPKGFSMDNGIGKDAATSFKMPFKARHPAISAIKETALDMIPYARILTDADERKKFMSMPKQNQVRYLLLQNLEAVGELGLGKIGEGLKPIAKGIAQKVSPRLTEILTKPLGKKTQTVAQKIASYADNYGERPPKEMVEGWWREAAPKKAAAIQPEEVIAPIKAEAQLPKYAGSVNLERQLISDEAKQLEVELFKQFGKKTKVTHKKLIEGAESTIQKFKSDPDYYKTRMGLIQKGAKPTIEEELAHRVLNAGRFEDFINLSKTGGEAFEKLRLEMSDSFFNIVNPLASDAGRRLGMYNIQVGKNRAISAISKLGKKLNPRQKKELRGVDWNNTASVEEFVARLPDPRLKDYVYEYWYNSILSGIPTHVVNTASNTLWLATQFPHRILTGAVDAAMHTLTGRERTVFMNEIVPMLAGLKSGFKGAAKNAWDVARTGKLREFETKWAKEMGGFLGAFERSPSKILRGAGKFITPPTKALRAMDTFFNSLAYDAQMGALKKRAVNLGIKYTEKELHEEALKFAKYSTFMDEPGWFGRMIMQGRDKFPGGRFIIPFVRTIGNLLKRGIEMTPGAGLTLAKGQNPSEVIAKQIEGSLVAFTTFMAAYTGKIELVGEVPTGTAARKAFYRQGKKAWSIGVGEPGKRTYIQYRRIEPFNTTLAALTIAYNKAMNAKDDETAAEAFSEAAKSVAKNFIDSSYLQGVTNILNRHGGAKGMPQRMAASFVPYSGFFRSMNRAIEAFGAGYEKTGTIIGGLTEGSAKIREKGEGISDINSWKSAFSQVIPFLSKLQRPEINIWGKDIKLQGGVFRQWLPYKWSTQEPDITEQALEKLEVYPGKPTKKFRQGNKDYEFDDGIYRKFRLTYGHSAKKKLDDWFVHGNLKGKSIQVALENESNHDRIRSAVDTILTWERNKARAIAIKEQLKKNKQKPLNRSKP